MRAVLAIVFALGMSIPAFAQDVELGISPEGLHVSPRPHPHFDDPYYGDHHHFAGGQCRELRKACLHKEDLGEEGQGNCRRYRAMCTK